MPGNTVDLVIPYATPSDPLAEWPATNQSMSERIETLLKGVQVTVGAGLTGDGSTATPLAVRTAMAWGDALAAKPDLDSYGADSTVGQPVYVDSVGDIRTQPLVIPGGSGFTAATLPGTYPVGMSLLSVPTSTPNPDGWPIGSNGAVHTLRRWGDTADNTTSAWQWCLRATGATANVQVFFRSGTNTTWSGWMDLARQSQDSGWVDIAVNSGFAVQGTEKPQVRLMDGVAHVRGGWSPTGLTTAGSYDVGVVPSGYRPPTTQHIQIGTGLPNVNAVALVGLSGAINLRVNSPFGNYYLFGGQSWPVD